jgi:hypothetical protein
MIATQALQAYTGRKLFWMFSSTLFASLLLYGYFLNQAIVHVVERETILEESSMLASRIGELEFQYIALENAISLAHARMLGFVDVDDPVFVTRTPDAKSITLSYPVE